MKKAVLIVILLCFTASLAPAQTGRGTNRNGRVEEEIRRLHNEAREAVLRGDLATLERLWSEDFVVTNPDNQILPNRQQVLERIRSGSIRYTSFERQIEYIRIHGSTAILMGRETVISAGDRADAGRTTNRRYTEVWMRQGGRWQAVARHANNIVQQ